MQHEVFFLLRVIISDNVIQLISCFNKIFKPISTVHWNFTIYECMSFNKHCIADSKIYISFSGNSIALILIHIFQLSTW